MTTARTTPPSAVDDALEQCCTCRHWSPGLHDYEQGKCGKQKSPDYGRVTLWSDGCKAWQTNQDRRTA